MLIVYASRTGNTERFINRINYTNVVKIISGDEVVNEPFVLVTYTDKFGEIPPEVVKFLEHNKNAEWLRAVAGSGNKNFGVYFCGGARVISEAFNIPLLMEFELSGREYDISNFRRIISSLYSNAI